MFKRMLRLKEAAAYCGIPPSRFRGAMKFTSSAGWDAKHFDAIASRAIEQGIREVVLVKRSLSSLSFPPRDLWRIHTATCIGNTLQRGLERI